MLVPTLWPHPESCQFEPKLQKGLGLLSILAFFSTCIVILRLKSINVVTRTFICLMLISGPLIGNAPASFGESLAVFVSVCLFISLLSGHWTTIFAFSLIAVSVGVPERVIRMLPDLPD